MADYAPATTPNISFPSKMGLLIQNLVSPVGLAFLLGVIARAVRSDLEIPSAVYQGLSITSSSPSA